MPPFTYDNLPPENRLVFPIDSHTVNTRNAYEKTIRWLRFMAGQDGVDVDVKGSFEGIRAVKAESGHPLMEVEMPFLGKGGEWRSVKVVMVRSDLYVIGFFLPATGRKFQFQIPDPVYKIDGFAPIKGFKVNYLSGPLKEIGIGAITDALYTLSDDYSPIHNRFLEVGSALEVFFVHFSEAARFRAFEVQIAETIAPVPTLPFEVAGNAETLTYQKFHIDTNATVLLPPYALDIIKNWEKLSTAWCIFILSQGEHYFLNENTSRRCNVHSSDALKCILGVVKPDLGNLSSFFSKKDEYPQAKATLDILEPSNSY